LPIRHGWSKPSLALVALVLAAPVALAGSSPSVDLFRLKTPDGQANIQQASDLCFGQVSRYDGLWIAPDRNSGESGNKIFLIETARLTALKPGDDASATLVLPVTGPVKGWTQFNSRHTRIKPEILADLRDQFENFARGHKPILDFEALTIGPRTPAPHANAARRHPTIGGAGSAAFAQPKGDSTSTRPASATSPTLTTPDPSDAALFAVTEQPYSIVLEFELLDGEHPRLALSGCFFYAEQPGDRGGDANDGLEGIAWSGKPGCFFICEEGTRPFRAGDNMHYFDQPRLMRATLWNDSCQIEEPWSTQATASVRSRHDEPSQSLNALTRLDDRTLAAVDRNGGWVLAIDIATGQARRWISLYDPKGLNLRQRLADFPQPRHMPYVSIEGIARDDRGNLWLCDDPAMPEGFRESCLIRVSAPPPLPDP